MQKYDYTHLNLSITELDYKNDKISFMLNIYLALGVNEN